MTGAVQAPVPALSPTRRPDSGRVRSLDGLRGLAAVVVVIHHSLLASAPRLASAYEPGPSSSHTPLERLLLYTPLHIVWAGQEFVVVFFVLSGFVLSLPTVRGKPLNVARYYPSRLVRLYVPVWAALACAAVLHLAVDHSAIEGASAWLDLHSQALTLGALLREMTLVTGAGDWGFTTVLWSLRWEVLFSLALPLLLWAMVRMPPRSILLVAVLCALVLLGHGSNEYLLELPPFLLGMVMAFSFDRIHRLKVLLAAPTPRNRIVETAIVLACVCGLTADWWVPGGHASALLVAGGACLAVAGALVVGWLAGLLESRPMQWVGKRSYSLYLVHEPIVVALAFLTGGRLAVVLYMALTLSASLLVAAGFFGLVERPSHGFARRAGDYFYRLIPRGDPAHLGAQTAEVPADTG